MKSLPCRWSISCCRQRASSSLGLDLERLAVEIRGAHPHARRTLHVAVHVRDRETALLGFRALGIGFDDLGVDDHEASCRRRRSRRRARCARPAARRARCPLARSIVSNMFFDQLAQLVGDGGDGRRLLAQHRVAEDPNVEHAHVDDWRARCDVAVPTMRAMRPRSTTSRDSPDLIVTRSSMRFAPPSLAVSRDVDDFADDAAGRHDLVALLERLERRLVLAAAASAAGASR